MSNKTNLLQNQSQGQIHQANFVDKYISRNELVRPSFLQQEKAVDFTKEKIEQIIDHKTFISQRAIAHQVQTQGNTNFVKYTSKTNPNDTKIVKIQEVPEDPFAPPQFKSKRIPQGPGSPPRTILRSPPRKLTAADQAAWKVPPCTSNWKNKKGYTIPLEMRLAADGRSSIQPTINENFSKFTSALYASEKTLRKELEEKEKMQQQLAFEDLKKAEQDIREKALLARQKRDQLFQDTNLSSKMGTQFDLESKVSDQDIELDEAEKKRNEIRAMIRKENVRNIRLENIGTKRRDEVKDRERQRDISERIALGQEIEKGAASEPGVDHRLLNGESGLNTGFFQEDQDNVYDKPLFKEQDKVNIYAISKGEGDMDDEGYIDNLLMKRNLKGKGKIRDEKTNKLSFQPVQFEKAEDADKAKKIKR